MSDNASTSQVPSKSAEPHPLDALSGGVFSAANAAERAQRVRQWLACDPPAEQLQEAFKELRARDKTAARLLRERLDEIRRASAQAAAAAEWDARARQLLAQPRMNIADALAWQRDAAKAGAPLSREPLAQLKSELAERVKVIEDLQHRVQVQREAAVLLAQRIEVLSTKPWSDAQQQLQALGGDVARWIEQAGELSGDVSWSSVEARYPVQLDASRTQLQVVWDAFQSALALAVAAAADAQAPLPPVPVWADELRVARGHEAQAQEHAAQPRPARVDPQRRTQAEHAVAQALAALQQETTAGHGKAASAAAAQLRATLKEHGRFIDAALGQQANAALVAAGELEGWQRWSADQVREELLAKALGLLARPEGQALGGRKIQDSLRELRDQWRQADQGAPANHALWKKFDEACNAAHQVVQQWQERLRAQAGEQRAQRLALIDEVKAWAEHNAGSGDWRAQLRALQQFGERWRAGGHVGEKLYVELQPLWKEALAAAGAPLAEAQKDSLARRQALIAQAQQLGGAPVLRVDAVKALQQRWQAEAQSVPLERRQEQKLWDAFRQPIDEAFARKGDERERAQAALGAHDRAVLDAAKALEAANAGGDAQQIHAAVAALQAQLRGQAAPPQQPAAPAQPQPADQPGVGVPAPAARAVVAVRGDDRPGAQKGSVAPAAGRGRDDRGAGRGARPAERERFGARDAREPRGPRLGDAAFRAQREALEQAQGALRRLAAQAHGQALTQLLQAWQRRDAAELPSAQELGRAVSAAQRASWVQALSGTAAGDADEALLRLEMAAEVPTPAEQLAARRALQLQLLTRRNDPAPLETWTQDTARVLASTSDAARERRLQAALKVLLRK